MWFILSFWRKSRIPCLYLCVCVSVQLHLWLVKSCNACNHTGPVSGSFDINLDMTLNVFKEWVYMDQTSHYKQCLVKRIAVIHICFSSLRFVLFLGTVLLRSCHSISIGWINTLILFSFSLSDIDLLVCLGSLSRCMTQLTTVNMLPWSPPKIKVHVVGCGWYMHWLSVY